MKSKIVKRLLMLSLAFAVAVTGVSLPEPSDVRAAQRVVPEPYYEFTFDQDVTNNQVENEGSKTGVFALIEGNREGLGVVEDEQRASHVLNLPGGQTNGAKEGRLTLPENMFADVTDAGFAFSFWINIDPGAAQYSRIFSATVNGQNSNDGWPWEAPEFAFVAGQEGKDDLGEGKSGYHTAVVMPDKTTMKLVWEEQFARGRWQHVTISVSLSAYDVYLDGRSVGIRYDRNNNMASFLQKLFADNASVLKQYKYSGIGPSVYKTDTDLKAKVDEFRFYNTALTAEQAKAAYDCYAVPQETITELQTKIDEAKAKSVSFYTKESCQVLKAAIEAGEDGIANPVTEANVRRLIDNLEQAIRGLVFYDGIDANTEFSNSRLNEEIALAKALIAQGSLSSESEQQIQAAVTAAEAAAALEAKKENQSAVDEALAALSAALDAKAYGSALHFDASPENSKGELLHGSTGFLYGVSEVNVPSADLIQAIAPKILVQKAADGQQHPSGDGYRLTPFLKACGVENIQIYLQDYYLEWPYEYKGIEDYNSKVDNIVRKMVAGKTEEEIAGYSFVLFNEPDGIWYNNSSKVPQLCEDWLKIYTTVKHINPAIKVAGPNFSVYNSNAYRTFFEYCQKNNCLPEYVTWHELQKDKLRSFKSHCDEARSFIDTYYAGSGIEPVIFVNEIANFSDVGKPGALVNWLSIFEEENAYASLPYWGLANSMNELAADANKPNGAWWVYKWYAQMTGNKMPLTLENIADPSAHGSLYGLTSADDEAGIIYSLFGGQAGKQTVSIENIRSTKTFQHAKNAYVKIYRTKFTGHHGFADEILVEFEGNLAFSGNDLVFTVSDAELMDTYFAVITPSVSDENTILPAYEKANWEETYEAENAKLIGSAESYKQEGDSTLARSNRSDVGHLNSENDGVEFSVNVPKDGRYRLNIYYSSQAPQVNPQTLEYVSSGGQNRAIGGLVTHSLKVDGGEAQDIVYDSTVKWGYYNYKTVYVDLTAGSHTITLMYKGADQNTKEVNSMLCAMLDKIDLTYAPDRAASVVIEPEELVGSKNGYTLSQDGTYSGAGSANGGGDFDFYVNAPRDGYYAVGTLGSGSAVLSKSKVNYAQNAKAESEVSVSWQKLFDIALGNENAGMVYLTAGMNHLLLTGEHLILDRIVFTEAAEATEENTITVEAEDCELTGTDAGDSYHYLPGSKAVPEVIETNYASGQKAVEGFRGGKDNVLTLTVNAPEAGNYKLSVYYSNNEPAPVMKKQNGDNYVHPYNTDLVERYMQIAVNGETPQTVYFKNTFCWDTYKNTVIDVALQKGTNEITFTNDNSYKFSSLQDDFAPRLDRFALTPAVLTDTKLPSVEHAAAPAITKQPVGASYTVGRTAEALSVEAEVSDGGVLSYQWYQNTVNSTEKAAAITGADKASYVPDTSSEGTVYYYCAVTNTNTSVSGTKTAVTNSKVVSIKTEKAGGTGDSGSTDSTNNAGKADNKITGISSTIKKAYGSKAFTIKAAAQGKISYRSSNTKVVKVNASTGKVTVTGCGMAVITVTAAGTDKYKSASAEISITVTPKKQTISSLKSKKKKALTVKWKKDTKASGYQIQYSTDKKFKKFVKNVWVKKSKTTSVTLKKLKAGKKYFVKVRAYKTSGKTNIYGSWSSAKNLKVKK